MRRFSPKSLKKLFIIEPIIAFSEEVDQKKIFSCPIFP